MKFSTAAQAAQFRKQYGIRSLSVALATKRVARTAKQRAHFGKLARALEKNPTAQARSAALLYEKFARQKAEPFGYVELPDAPAAAAIMGYCFAIEYDTVREGKKQRFRHKFHRSDAPVLAVGPRGTPILLIGGHYSWTDRGIVDRSEA